MRCLIFRAAFVFGLMAFIELLNQPGNAQMNVRIAPAYARPPAATSVTNNKTTSTSEQLQSFFASHACTPASFGTRGVTGSSINALWIAPFMTPPEGVEFNGISTYISANACYGVYDQQGQLVLAVNQGTTNGLQVIKLSGRLPGSKMFYTVWGYATGTYCEVRPGFIGSLPNAGKIPNGMLNGQLPQTFDPAAIQAGDTYPVCITFLQYGPAPEPTPTPQDVQVLQPMGGEAFMANDFMPIHWRTNLDTAGSGVKFELYHDAGWVADLGGDWNANGENSQSVYLPLLATGNVYRVRVVSTWNPQLFADSPPVTISGKPVLVIKPNGGESWAPGSRQDIHWKTNVGIAGTAVTLELWRSGMKVADLGQAWDPDGESVQTVTLPYVPAGADYRIRVVSAWSSAMDDESDADFSIVAPVSKAMVESQSWPIYQ